MNPKAVLLASLLALVLCNAHHLAAAEASSSVPLSPVVSTAWLADHLADPDLVILHIGPRGSYEERHLPGARSASLQRLLRIDEAGIRDEMPGAADISAALAELGIDRNARIVVYFADENAAWAAARYLLTLEFLGMSGRVAYLDGGLPKWVTETRPVSADVPAYEATDFTAADVPDVVVDTEWLRTRLEDPGIAIVDGRPAEGYAGLAGHGDRLGHIPGAGNVPFFTLLAEEPPYLLKSRDALAALFGEAGVQSGDTVVVYCGTGLWASLPYLAARHLGYPVRLYDGSFQAWSANENLPVAASASRDE